MCDFSQEDLLAKIPGTSETCKCGLDDHKSKISIYGPVFTVSKLGHSVPQHCYAIHVHYPPIERSGQVYELVPITFWISTIILRTYSPKKQVLDHILAYLSTKKKLVLSDSPSDYTWTNSELIEHGINLYIVLEPKTKHEESSLCLVMYFII